MYRVKTITRIIALIAGAALWLKFSTGTNAQVAKDIAQKTFPSVALIAMQDAHGQSLSLGSGFILGDGIIATCFHVIEGASRGYVKLVGQKTRHNITGTVGLDLKRDIVLLAVSGLDGPPLQIGRSDQVAVGDEVFVVGNPLGLEGTFSQGIVSGIREVGLDRLFQITAPISPGSSGGPVLNKDGDLVGIAAATFEGGQNLNFAIPSSNLKSLLQEIKTPTPLQAQKRSQKEKTFLQGGRNTRAISGSRFTWQGISVIWAGYSFSLRNELSQTVKEVNCLVIFYDRSGEPVDVDEFIYYPEIPPGLAKRVVRDREVDLSVMKFTARVEVRVLDFRIVQ